MHSFGPKIFRRSCAITFVSLLALGSSATNIPANEFASPISFDAPALIAVQEVLLEEDLAGIEKTIEVIVPISSEIQLADRQNIREFRFDVSWNREVFPIVDYGPKTKTFSDIEGLVNVESSSDKRGSVGFNLSGAVDPINTSAKLDASSSNSQRESYQRIPNHEVLVASGTVSRGTGAFFRFHPSKIETLEGGRDLIVAFRVPRDWRAGLLQVQCRAVGERRIVGAWKEPLEFGRSFIVPIYLEGDDQGRRSATEFVRSEQTLRKSWTRSRSNRSGSELWPHPIFGNSPFKSNANSIPEQWVHLLIQSGDDAYLEKYQRQLPQEVAVDAGKFVQARKNLLQLNR